MRPVLRWDSPTFCSERTSPCVRLPSPRAFACEAYSSALFAEGRVLWRKFMAVLAVRFSAVVNRRPRDILCVGHRLHVVRVDAFANPAQVVDVEAIRDRPDVMFIAPSVSEYCLAVYPEYAVSTCVGVCGPAPAVIHGLINLGREPLFGRTDDYAPYMVSASMPAPPVVVHPAPPPVLCGLVAVSD